MNQQLAPSPAHGQPAFLGAVLFPSESADLRRGTWTFKLPDGATPRAGLHAIIPAEDLRGVVQCDARATVLYTAPQGANVAYKWMAHIRGFSVSICEPGPSEFESGRELMSVTLYREHTPDPDRGGWRGPSVWWGSETRVDQHGEEWTRMLRLITDDFGDLVPQPAEFRQ